MGNLCSGPPKGNLVTKGSDGGENELKILIEIL